MSSPRPHDFWLRKEGSRNEKWHWRVLNASEVARYSVKLGLQVRDDRLGASSQVELCDGVSEDAMKIIISAMPSKDDDDDDLPALRIDDRDPQCGFNELLSLAISCWKFDCAIPPVCEKFAKDFVKNWSLWYGPDFFQQVSGPEIGKPINWMFIALVFEWEKIFTNASRHVFVRYDINRFFDENTDLPEDFRG